MDDTDTDLQQRHIGQISAHARGTVTPGTPSEPGPTDTRNDSDDKGEDR